MSGAIPFVRSGKPRPGPVEEKLAIEDNRRLYGSLGVGHALGAGFIAWALSLQVVIHRDLLIVPDPPDREPPKVVFDPHRKVALPKPQAPVAKAPERRNDAPVARTLRPAQDEPGRLEVAAIGSRTERLDLKAYDLLTKAFDRHVDQDKLERVGRLTRTEGTRLSGRRGRYSEEFNPAYSETGTGGDGLGLLPGITGGRIEGAPRGTQPLSLSRSEVSMASEGRHRSTESILAVVRAHSPGLRHLYNTHLKQNPGLGGKVTVRFAIAPSGRVVDAALVASTTGSREFDAQVLSRVVAWNFGAIQASGEEIVTVPFSFSE